MKQTKFLIAAAIGTLALASCQKQIDRNPATGAEAAASEAKAGNQKDDEDDDNTGHVYTMSNEVSGNKVIDYVRGANGQLSFAGAYTTGGNGSGGGLGNQGAVVFSDDRGELLAVNAGSNTISVFKITKNGLRLRSVTNSGGMRPISIAVSGHIVFVLNGGGDGNISGFRMEGSRLWAIPGSTRPLSSTATGPAQISFVNNGRVLVVTEKATNKIITYTVGQNGRPGAFHSITSASPTPFGFATGRNGNIFVSEAVGGAPNSSNLSSYNISNNGSISLLDGPVSTTQTAACWVVLTRNGRFAYTTNTASNTISAYSTNNPGNLNLQEAVAATSNGGPIDAALSGDSKFLYVLNNAGNSITAYTVGNNGALSSLQTVSGLAPGANGLAAW